MNMETYHYRIIGSSIIGSYTATDIDDLTNQFTKQWGLEVKFEYWSN